MNEKAKQVLEKIENTTNTKTFCVLPWIHVATRPNGDARLCCGSNASQATKGILDAGNIKKENGEPANFGRENLYSAFNNEYMRNVRTTMINGNIPLSCSKCFEEEAAGMISKRIWETHYWDNEGIDLKELIDNTQEDGSIPTVVPYLDLRLGHTCNLKCVMCTPNDSSRWMQDYDKLIESTDNQLIKKQVHFMAKEFNNTWYERPEFWNEIFEQIPNIRQLYFAGGEPLMIKEHRKLLEEVIKRGYADKITLRYNSNGTLVEDWVIELWRKFKQVKFGFSIDALADRNHYIRYPTEWQTIVDTLHKLDNTPDNIIVNIACAVQIFNIQHLMDFAKWKIQQNFRKINKSVYEGFETGGGIISMHLLYIPTFLSARLLPSEDKIKLREKFLEFKQWLWDHYRQDDDFWKINPQGWARWEGLLKFVEAEDHSHLVPDFREYVSKLDKIRCLDAKKIFPELEHLLNDVL
jgi:MoaA/NifB/PqqE/SkfB family radical SAM enzyme